MKPLRKNVVIDFGPVVDQLGAVNIITPDKYKRINNIGTIIAVADRCQLISPKDIGKKCVIGIHYRDDCRYKTDPSKEPDKKPHWNFIVPEDKVELYLE